VQLAPDNADLRANLGNVLQNLGRTTDAFASFQDTLKLDPRHWRAAAACGSILRQWKRFKEALEYFDLCDALQPNHSPTLQSRALSLRDLKRNQEYLAESRRVHALDPGNAEILAQIAEALQLLGQYEESLEWLDRLLNLRPNDVEALKTKAYSLSQLLRIDEAAAVNNRIDAIDPGNTAAEWNLSLLRILEGDFETGWAGREVRWKIPALSSHYPKFAEPMWLGEQSVEGKTILVHIDEGQGDAIQFARYVPMLAERGARIILVVDGSLYSLLSRLPGVSQCFKRPAATLPPFDFHCPLTSLPIPFGTRLDNIPAPTCYLPEPSSDRVQVWKDRLGAHDRLRVGLVWCGNPNHFNDLNRSIPLQRFTQLLDADATFVSLQKEPRPGDKAVLSEFGDIIDLTAHFTDFADTAALVRCLDLVISVDTSVAHLAAALGCPTWMLLPYAPDHRWMLHRSDSPWYPTMRLFRQTESRDYAPVITRIREELLQLIAQR
jgi:Flp pilus assembly protein TadD